MQPSDCRRPPPGKPIDGCDIVPVHRGHHTVVKLVDVTDVDRALFIKIRDDLHNALLKLELREQDVARLETRNAYLEGELTLLERHYTNALKANIVLKQQAAAAAQVQPRSKSRAK
jgi:hypothetical protein